MSFRNRLALFFVLIVIVPMLAVAFLLFRLIDESERGKIDAAIAQQHSTAVRLFGEQRDLAAAALAEVAQGMSHGGDPRLSQRAAGGRPRSRARAAGGGADHRRPDRAAGLEPAHPADRLRPRQPGPRCRPATARRSRPPCARCESTSGRQLGELALSITDAPTYARRVRALTAESQRPGLHVVVANGDRLLGSTLQAGDLRTLAEAGNETLTLDGVEYRVQSFSDPNAFPGQKIRVFTLGAMTGDASSASDNRTFAAVILLGFLLLAIACAMLVSRTLQREIAGFLTAARKLAAGDFSAQVPTAGRDEFAALGEEFNKMSGELERRLAELSQERGRVQSSMRRLGEAVASNLDRDALLELVVRTAVDGVGADAGRACVRVNGSGSARRALARGQPARPRGGAAVRRGRRPEQRQRARDDRRRDDGDRPSAARRRCAQRGRRRRLRRAQRARSRPATASCSPTSPARSRARWRTSSCTRRRRAARSPTS